MKAKGWWFAAAAAVVLTAGVRGQDQPPIRSGVQVVQIDARVFDGQGRFVPGLTRDDFELLENGVPQQIQSVLLIEEAAGPAAVTPGPDAADAPAAAPHASAPRVRQTWVFFFDLGNLTPGAGFDRARQAVERFIADRFQDGDLAGIVVGDKMVNNKLTTVREELLEGLKQVRPRSDSRARLLEMTREWPRLSDAEEAIRIARNERDAVQRAVIRACAEEPEMCKVSPPDMAVRDKGTRLARDIQRASLDTMTAINALGSGLARIPGPKTVVFLSDGFVALDQETTLRSVVGQMSRAGGRVYAIDVRGLGRLGAPGGDQLAADDPAGPSTRFDVLADAPNSLAVDTGGLMIRNENNIGRALDTVARDAGRYYLLAYEPANTTWDGQYRAVDVRVKRDGVRVRARRGYLALDPARMLAPQPIDRGSPDGRGAPARGAPTTEPVRAPARGAPTTEPVGAALAAAPDPAGTDRPSPPAVTTGTVVESEAGTSAPGLVLRPDAARQVESLAGGALVDGSALATEGWTAYQRGDLESAVGPLARAAEAPGARPWVLYALGLTQAGLGRPADAITAWERARAGAPEFDAVYIDLAATYGHVGDLTAALDVLRDAERRWPHSADVHNGIGVIHVRRGALDEAIAAFTAAAEAEPGDPLAQFNLARTYELRFGRSQRYVSSQRRWTTDDQDRRLAIAHYETYLKMGGPHAAEVRDALRRLDWSK